MRNKVTLFVLINAVWCCLGQKSALLIIDVQKCFLPGGTLPLKDGDEVIGVINSIRDNFEVVVMTQDWHCTNHISFASQHPEHEIYDTISLVYDENGALCKNNNCGSSNSTAHKLNQTLWPDHCVMNTEDAKLSPSLAIHSTDIIIKKGFNCEVDSYSAFFDNGGFSKTQLQDKLMELNVDTVYVAGLALDFCVFYSAMDAKHLGFETYVIQDASRGLTPEGVEDALLQMHENGIQIIQSDSISGSHQICSHCSSIFTSISFTMLLLRIYS